MEEQKKETKTEDMKVSYEKLKEIAVQLSKENAYLKQRLQGCTEALNAVSRLDYLLRIVEVDRNSRHFQASFDREFVESCIEEIQQAMTLPEQKEQSSEESKEEAKEEVKEEREG